MFERSLMFAAISAAYMILFELTSRNKRPVSVGLTTLVVNLVVNMGVIYLSLPYFTYTLVGGYPLLIIINGIIGAVISLAFAASEEEDYTAASRALWVGVGFFVVWAVVVGQFTQPGLVCDNAGYKRMVSLLSLEETDVPYPDTDLDELIRVSPATAMLMARRAMGGDTNLGSYLTPNKAHLQQVQGHWYYIVDLSVTSWRAFRTRGAVVPGYIVVDAMNPQTEAELRTGYQMKYVPAARFNLDLERYVYMSFIVSNPWRIDDLSTLEVDDEWNPYYTATLLKHEIGWSGKVVDGVITVDPQSGEIVRYGLEDRPEWIDRIWSLSLAEEYVGWWGSYHDHDACQFEGTAGMRKIDRVNDVVTSEGLAFQITMTSVGSDQSLTEVIYFEPLTGRAIKYPITGATVAAVDNLVDEVSRETTAEGYEPVDCELQVLLGQQVWYCILNGRGGGADESSGSYAGVGFVQASQTSDNTKVIIDETLQGAYAQLRRQIAQESTDDPTLSGTQDLLEQYSGLVDRKILYETTEGESYYFFSVVNGARIYYFQVGADDFGASWMVTGDRVTVTAFPVEGNDFLQVVAIENHSAPNLEQ